MSNNENVEYQVVMNDEQQYSIWPTLRALPDGWRIVEIPDNFVHGALISNESEHQKGSKHHCLEFIASVWQDIRPLTLRQQENQINALSIAKAEQE